MATTRPLKLKRESYAESLAQAPASSNPIATVLVYVPSSTIPDLWDYLVSDTDDAKCLIGSLVRVPFGGKVLEGIVLSRRNEGAENSYKYIHSVLSTIPPLRPQQIHFLPELAQRYGCNQSELLESIFPPFSKSGEKAAQLSPETPISPNAPLRKALRLIPSDSDLHQELLAIVDDSAISGKKIFIFPELHQLERFANLLESSGTTSIQLHSNLSKSLRYQRYLEANADSSAIILTLRNGALLNSGPNDLLVAIDDLLSTHYDGRSPSWNTRDVLLVRSSTTNILFLNHAPSLELIRLVDLGWLPLSHDSRPSKRKRIIAEERSPESSYHPIVSEALKRGSVLLIHNSKGFINSFSCSQCRNLALCDCGGKLTLTSIADTPICSICKKEDLQWKCRWCGTLKPRIAQKGIHYSGKELAASFPKVSIVISTADHRIDVLPPGNHLVLSTAGCEPFGSYQAIVYLNADRDFASSQMRSQERTRNHWAQLLTLLHPEGTFFLEMPSSHVAIQDLIKGNFLAAGRKEILERDELHLPPHNRLLALFGEQAELQRIVPLLIEEKLDFVGPFADPQSRTKIIIKVAHENASHLLATLVSVNKVQAAKGRALFSLHVDPPEL